MAGKRRRDPSEQLKPTSTRDRKTTLRALEPPGLTQKNIPPPGKLSTGLEDGAGVGGVGLVSLSEAALREGRRAG